MTGSIVIKYIGKEIANKIAQKKYEELEEVVELNHFSTEHLKHFIEGQMQENDISHLDQVEEEDLIAENICCEEIYEDEKESRMSYEFSEDREACGIFLELEFFYASNDEVKARILITEGHWEINDLPNHMDHFSDKKYYDMYDGEVSAGIYDNDKGIWIEYHFSAEGECTDLTLQLDFLFTDDRNVCKPVICGFDMM